MSVIDINLDFQIIETNDTRYLSVSDYSNWGLIKDKPSIVEITVPASKSFYTHYWNKGETNVFNSLNLGLNCPTGDCDDIELLDLPDGVYTITLKGSPDSYNKTRSFLRTTQTQLELDKLFIKADAGCKEVDRALLKKIDEIEFLISSAEANVRYDNICEAQELFFKAQDKIEKIKDCNGCVGA